MNVAPLTQPVPPAKQPASPATKRHGKGRLDRVGPLAVLNLEGSFFEMGEQHGALLAEEVRRGPIPYFQRMVERLLGKQLGSLAPHICTALQRGIGSQVERALPGFALETIRGIARGAGVEERAFLRGCTMPDSLLWLTSKMHKLQDPGPAVAHRLSLGLGCTSAVAWGASTVDGALYHARNFDYFGVENWPQHAAVIFHTPTKGHRYVSIGAAGVGLGGVTAMNEAGLSLTVHQHMFTSKAQLGGTPIGVVGDIVMREASSLEQAEAILRKHKSIGCWTYVVTDAKAKRVLCFEENPERQVAIFTKPADTSFTYANIYLDPELGATEDNLYGSYWRHNEGRFRRAKEVVGLAAGSLDARGMARVLADTGSDPRCRIRDSIAMVMTVGSIIFRPEDGAFWLGTGVAPVSRGAFMPFSLKKMGPAPELGSFTVEDAASPASEEAFEHFRRAYLHYVDDADVGAAIDDLEAAATKAPDQSLYHAAIGLLSVEAGSPERAKTAFDRAITLGHPDVERVASFHLWRGRAKDLVGQRAEAQADYRVCLGHKADRPVHDAAKKNLGKPFRPSGKANARGDVARRRRHALSETQNFHHGATSGAERSV